ncbi:MAG: NADH-quinone oxidoreductase subunit C [candidate division Zixibacteria bacterium]
MNRDELTQKEKEVLDALKEQFGDSISGHERTFGQLSIFVENNLIFNIAQFLKDNEKCGFETVSDICGVDWIDCSEMRYEIVYVFYSFRNNTRVLIRTTLPDVNEPKIRSIQPLYPGADWLEREVYDMLGIVFEGHPDLRRILTPEGFEDWPHRKDFPLTYEMPHFSHNKNKPPEIIK